MTTHRTLPSEVEPALLADLIADCRALPRRILDLTVDPARATARRVLRLPDQREPLVIPDTTASMVAGFDDYGT